MQRPLEANQIRCETQEINPLDRRDIRIYLYLRVAPRSRALRRPPVFADCVSLFAYLHNIYALPFTTHTHTYTYLRVNFRSSLIHFIECS